MMDTMTSDNARHALAFAAPAQQILYHSYGDPRLPGWEARWMTLWRIRQQFPWFPKEALYLHKDFKPLLESALGRLQAAGLHHEIKTCEGAFNIRHVRGSYSVLSVHSWGAAVDLNARTNPLGSEGRWTPEFLAAMTAARVFCGQLWTGRKDPMHFAMVNG